MIDVTVLQPCANTELFSNKQASFDNSCVNSNGVLMAMTACLLLCLLSHLERTPGMEEPSMLNYMKGIIINIHKTLMKHNWLRTVLLFTHFLAQIK